VSVPPGSGEPWPLGWLEGLAVRSAECLGYPSHHGFTTGELADLLALPLNNLGDPFSPSRSATHAHDLEREVVRAVARVAGADPEKCRGYVTSGSTESVVHALAAGRDTLRAVTGIRPFVVASDQAHGCVSKAAKILDLDHIPVPSGSSGALDIPALASILSARPNHPCLAVATCGTTFLGAVDPVGPMARALEASHPGRHRLHIDAALAGFLLPHTGASDWNLASGGHSFSVSGHKMLGVPVPCGISVWLDGAFSWDHSSPGYLGGPDITLSGSRAGLAAGALWLALCRWPRERLLGEARQCLENARWLAASLREAGWPALRHPHSATVVFPKPADHLCQRWQLHVEGGAAHVVVVPRVSRRLLDQFIESLGPAPEFSCDFLPERTDLR